MRAKVSAYSVFVDPTLSPSDDLVACVVREADFERDRFISRIWLLHDDGVSGSEQLCGSDNSRFPTFSPDGRRLAFVRARDGSQEICVASLETSVVDVIASHPERIGRLSWDAAGERIAYATREPTSATHEPRLIRHPPYRVEGEGWISHAPMRVFVAAVGGTAAPEPVSSGLFDSAAPAWCPCGRHLVYTSARHAGRAFDFGADVWLCDVDTGEEKRLSTEPRPSFWPLVSPSESEVYYVALTGKEGAGCCGSLFTEPMTDTAATRRLTPDDTLDLATPLTFADVPMRLTLGRLHCLRLFHGAVQLAAVSPDGAVDVIVSGDYTITGFDGSDARLIYVRCDDRIRSELLMKFPDGEYRLAVAPRTMRTRKPPRLHAFDAHASDGYPVEGFVARSKAASERLVVLVHGGPLTQAGYRYSEELEALTGAGFNVVTGNPRGSAGYGEAHGRAIIGQPGTCDLLDVIGLIEGATRDLGLPADGPVGVYGVSYGAYLAGLVASCEKRIRAAVLQSSLTDWRSQRAISDGGLPYVVNYLAGAPDPPSLSAVFQDASPPILLIHGENDRRCPLQQAEHLFISLFERQRDVALLVFPGLGHGLSQAPRPSQRLARLEALVDWFERYVC